MIALVFHYYLVAVNSKAFEDIFRGVFFLSLKLFFGSDLSQKYRQQVRFAWVSRASGGLDNRLQVHQ